MKTNQNKKLSSQTWFIALGDKTLLEQWGRNLSDGVFYTLTILSVIPQ